MYQSDLALFMFKFQANQLPSSFSHYFQKTNMIHMKQTRSATNYNYFQPRYKTMKVQRTIKYQGAKLWNLIPDDIKKSTSLNQFKKKKLKMFLLIKYTSQ